MYLHHEVSRQLAEAKIELARSQAQRASARLAASLDERDQGVAAAKRGDVRTMPMLAILSRWRWLSR